MPKADLQRCRTILDDTDLKWKEHFAKKELAELKPKNMALMEHKMVQTWGPQPNLEDISVLINQVTENGCLTKLLNKQMDVKQIMSHPSNVSFCK